MRKGPWLGLVAAALLAACGDAGEGAITALPESPAQALARQLVGAKDLRSSVAATREILARGGVATFDGSQVLVPAIGPAANFQATPGETVRLARDARQLHAGRLTAAELAQMLEGFGFPFRDADPGEAADAPWVGRIAPEDQRAHDQAVLRERNAMDESARASGRDAEAQATAQQQATRAREQELLAQLSAATHDWQLARQAWAKAPKADKAAAQAAVQEQMDRRNALIAQRQQLQSQANDARLANRRQAQSARDGARREQEVRRRVGPDYRKGEQLMEMLAVWVREAAKDPDDPRNFTPLFLAEMARLQDPPLDLAGSADQRPGRDDGSPVDLRAAPRSAQLRLSLLEIELMAAAFHRADTPLAAQATGRASQRASALMDWVLPAAHASEPCSDFKKALGEFGGDVAGTAAGVATGDALDAAVALLVDERDAAAFGNAMFAMGVVAKITRLVAFTSDERVSVSVEPRSTHKPPAGRPDVTFTATAGVGKEDWDEFQKTLQSDEARLDHAVRDCLATMGLPSSTELSDIARDAENWLVEWRLVDGAPPHATYGLRKNHYYLEGRGAMKLTRNTPHSAVANFVVDIAPEAEHQGTIVRAYVTAEARVDAAGMPSVSVLWNSAMGGLGLVDSLAELFAGWFQYMNMPRAYATVEVEYHCPKPTMRRPTGKVVADGGGGDGPNECLIAAGRE